MSRSTDAPCTTADVRQFGDKAPEVTVTARHLRAMASRMTLHGWSVRELAKRASVSPNTVHKILAGHQMASSHLPRLLETLGIDPGSDAATLDAIPENDVRVMAAQRDLMTSAGAVVETFDAGRVRMAAAVLDALARVGDSED